MFYDRRGVLDHLRSRPQQQPRKNTENVPDAPCYGGSLSYRLRRSGATTARAFGANVGQILAPPALRPGQAVVLDNLGAHEGDRVRELSEARGCELLFLPAYSPNF